MLFSTGIASPIEFPKASGIRIGAVSNKTDGKKFSLSYRVNLPAAMTGKGRVQKQFSSLCAAKDFASQQHQNAQRHGHHIFTLTPDQLFDCSKAPRLLEDTDLRLEQVVEFALPKLKPEQEDDARSLISYCFQAGELNTIKTHPLSRKSVTLH